MKLTLSSSPYQRVKRDTGQVMRLVIYAMVPGIIAQTVFFGWGTLIQAFLAVASALVFEGVILWLRKRPIERTLTDYSAILTGLLIAISIPPTLPWWMTITGVFFAIAVAKQVYGGLGFNIFNPAMIGYVVLLISFPAAMSLWLPPQHLASLTPSFLDSAALIFTDFSTTGYDVTQLRTVAGGVADGVTMATPLDTLKTDLTLGITYSESLLRPIFSTGLFQSAGAGWGWVSLSYLLGGLWLVRLKVISWHIPGSMLASVAAFSLLLYMVDADHYASPLFHLINGAVIVGAFFIATDPVSASTTPKGRIIFGAAIGFWVVIIRVFGGYPDAIAFAVIIMNMVVPLIDYYTRPRTYGHQVTKKARRVE
ncbi:electron transport complex subunit D [Alteromonas stellipolaris]|jgi:electron transport complex protein RnfD|uniref:electron transport complex subunit RsxD n=1 Tax=Alteromonas stellipolaris TaxID=233316 RepID=UPI0007703097|nr:electron transport complex subunit RsxD [Alteromonas stellipolaris]AMJ94487.1 electron transport complex subunit D [Alteromonas stellipolaris]ANB26535.1 electron transport complex subunit RsxD [Alteromonas stellipolaris]